MDVDLQDAASDRDYLSALEAGLEACEGRPLLNSVTGEEASLEERDAAAPVHLVADRGEVGEDEAGEEEPAPPGWGGLDHAGA